MRCVRPSVALVTGVVRGAVGALTARLSHGVHHAARSAGWRAAPLRRARPGRRVRRGQGPTRRARSPYDRGLDLTAWVARLGNVTRPEERDLTGLRPSPTRHAVVGFRHSGRLALGPAVRLADRRHPLRLDVLTMTRSAYLQVRCAAVVQVGRAVLTLHPLFRGLGAKLDSISPTLSVQDFLPSGGRSI